MITKLRSSARRVSKAHSSAVARSAAGCTIFSWKEHHLIAKDAGRTMASNCAGSRNIDPSLCRINALASPSALVIDDRLQRLAQGDLADFR